MEKKRQEEEDVGNFKWNPFNGWKLIFIDFEALGFISEIVLRSIALCTV